MAGQVLSAAKQLTWLVDAAVSICQAMGAPYNCFKKLETLAFRVKHGIGVEVAPLSEVVGSGVSRKVLVALASQGFHTPQALAEASAGVLETWMSKSEAKDIRERAFRITNRGLEKQGEGANLDDGAGSGGNGSGTAVLMLDEGRPGEIRIEGKRVELQDKQFRLMSLLARNAGNCVSYDEIYQELWPDTIVEGNQIHFQKRKLKKAIEGVAPEYSDLIRTVPKRGFILQLEPGEVNLLFKQVMATQLSLEVGEVPLAGNDPAQEGRHGPPRKAVSSLM